MPMATFPEIFNELLFGWTLWGFGADLPLQMYPLVA